MLSVVPAGPNAGSNATLSSGSDSEQNLDDPDSDSDSESATTTSSTSTTSTTATTPIVTAGEANPDALVTRQSFANTVAASPSKAPQAESAATARHFVRKHPLSVALVIAMIAAGIAYYPTENALSNLHSGEELLAKGDPQGALTNLTLAISSNPHLGAAYIARARAYSQTGASDLALADCDKAIGLQPDKPEGYEQRANIELPLGRFRQTIADLESVSRITGTKTPAALSTLGRAYLGDGQYSRALTQFSKKLDREPEDVQSIVAKAQCYQAMNLPHIAIATCDAAIAKAGNTYDAYVLRGQCEDQLNNRTPALNDFGKAILLDGQRADAFLSRALLYAHTEDFTKAMQDLDIGIKLPGGIPDGLYKRALVYAIQHDRNNALKQFQLLEAKPNYTADNWFLIQRSDVFAQLQDFKMAKADLEKALSGNKSYQTACWLRLARCYESEHDYKKAAFYASKVLANEPTNTTVLLKHSEYSLLSGNRMTGLADLFKAIEVDPKNVMAYSNRGDLYVADKQYNLADDDYQKASQLAPLNTEIKKKLVACNALIRKPKLTI
jgi:tetratricopeptide (TPR) repeat protein